MSYFKQRTCTTLIRPVHEEKRLANIENEKWENLRPAFL